MKETSLFPRILVKARVWAVHDDALAHASAVSFAGTEEEKLRIVKQINLKEEDRRRLEQCKRLK